MASTAAKVSAFTTDVVAKTWKRMDTTQVLHVVFDRNNKMSIKSAYRTARQDGCSRVFKLNDEASLPGQPMALNVAANKEQLIRLPVKHLCKLIVPYGKRLVVTGPDRHPVEVRVGAVMASFRQCRWRRCVRVCLPGRLLQSG